MSKYHNKDINNIGCFIENFENVFVCWHQFGSHRSSSLELLFTKVFVKNFCKIYKKIPLLESLFWKIRLQGKLWHRCSSVNCANFFQNPSFEGWQWMAVSEANIQINPSKSRNFLREISEPKSVKVKPLALRFSLILIINQKLMTSW